MSSLVCPACGEREKVTIDHVVHDGRRMVTVTCTQIIHAEPLISLVEDSNPLSGGSSDIDAALLLTWSDPEAPAVDDAELARRQATTARGDTFDARWDAGRRKHGVDVGTRVFLLKQFGDEGILARGTALGSTYVELGTDDDTRWLDVTWDAWLPADRPLPDQVLRDEVPDGNWSHRFQSGTGLDEQASLDVETLFAQHLDDLDLSRSAANAR